MVAKRVIFIHQSSPTSRKSKHLSFVINLPLAETMIMYLVGLHVTKTRRCQTRLAIPEYGGRM
jgi:hypothetical protein